MHTEHTAQIDRLGDLCCLCVVPPLFFHNHIQWVQERDLYVSLEEYFPSLYYIASLSRGNVPFDTAAGQGKSMLVQSDDMLNGL